MTGPVLGITGAAAIGAEQRQQKQGKKAGPAADKGKDSEVGAEPGPTELPTTPPDPLIEALDRLRTTDGERSAEGDVLRLLRGRKTYQDGG